MEIFNHPLNKLFSTLALSPAFKLPTTVETQIWIAISTYLLVAIAKKRLNLKQPLAQILHILSISLFEKEPLFYMLNRNDYIAVNSSNSNQLNFLRSRSNKFQPSHYTELSSIDWSALFPRTLHLIPQGF